MTSKYNPNFATTRLICLSATDIVNNSIQRKQLKSTHELGTKKTNLSTLGNLVTKDLALDVAEIRVQSYRLQ